MNQKKTQPKAPRRGIERSLAIKGMIGNKKNSLEIFLLFAAAFFLIQSIFILTDSVRNTLLEQRMDQYGEWEYSLPGRFLTQLGAVAEKTGNILVLGIMQPAGGGESVSVGVYDQDALGLARLSLLEGRLPEHPGEIAIEMEALIRLGLPYEAGMDLELRLGTLQKTEGLTADYVFPEKTSSYTVCGVIKSYSSGWSTAKRHDIPNAIVAPDTQAVILETLNSEGWRTEDIVFRNYVLFTLKRGINGGSLTEYLEGEGIPSGDIVHNSKTYPENPYSVLDGVLRQLSVACSLIACCLLLLTVTKNISLQRASFRQLACLGAGRGQIRGIILRQCLFYVGAALPCGLLCGAAAGSGLIWLGTVITGIPISLKITGEGVFFSLTTGLAVTGVGSVIPVLLSKEFDSERKKRRCPHGRRRKRKKKFRRERLPYRVLAEKTFTGASGRSFFIVASAGIYLAVIFQIMMQIQGTVHSYQDSLESEADYKVGDVNLTETELEDLRRVPGVEAVSAVKLSRDFYLYPGSGALDSYFDAVKEKQGTFLPRPGIESKEITTTIIGLDQSERNDKMLAEEFGLTGPALERFYRGEFLCIFLPALYVAENPGQTMAQVYEGYFAEPVPLLRNDSLKEGDVVRLTYAAVKKDAAGGNEEIVRESREYEIGAIAELYSLSNAGKENVSANAYGIMMSGTLFGDFSNYSDGSRYQTIWIKTNDEATYESTDKAVQTLAAKANTTDFINMRLVRQERFERMLTDVSGLLFIMTLLTLLLAVVLYHLYRLETESVKDRLSLLTCFGIRRGVLWRMYTGRAVLTGILCGILALGVYLAMLLSQAAKEAERGRYSLYVLIFRRLQMTDWRIVGITAALFAVIMALISCDSVRKILKRGIAENIS